LLTISSSESSDLDEVSSDRGPNDRDVHPTDGVGAGSGDEHDIKLATSQSVVNYTGAWFVNDDPETMVVRSGSSSDLSATPHSAHIPTVNYHCCWSWHPQLLPPLLLVIHPGVVVELELVDQPPGFGLVEVVQQPPDSDVQVSILWFYNQDDWAKYGQTDKRGLGPRPSRDLAADLYLSDHQQSLSVACVRRVWPHDQFINLHRVCSPPPSLLGSLESTLGVDAIVWSAVQWAAGEAGTSFEERMQSEQIHPLLGCGNGVFKRETLALWGSTVRPFPWTLRSVARSYSGVCFACKLTKTLSSSIQCNTATIAGYCGSTCARRIECVIELATHLAVLRDAALAFVRDPTHAGWNKVRSCQRQVDDHRVKVVALTAVDA
jgi:hypothetical protein